MVDPNTHTIEGLKLNVKNKSTIGKLHNSVIGTRPMVAELPIRVTFVFSRTKFEVCNVERKYDLRTEGNMERYIFAFAINLVRQGMRQWWSNRRRKMATMSGFGKFRAWSADINIMKKKKNPSPHAAIEFRRLLENLATTKYRHLFIVFWKEICTRLTMSGWFLFLRTTKF